MTLVQTAEEIEKDFYAPGLVHRQTHQIHTSEMRSFQGCRRRWNWAYQEGYVPHTTPKPLELGIAFHKAMEVVYNPDTWFTTTPQEKLQSSIEEFTRVCEGQRLKFLSTTHQDKLLEADGDDYAERIDLGIGMLTLYCLTIHPVMDNWFKPVAVEISFQVPINHPNGQPLRCYADDGSCGQLHDMGAPVTFDGRIDALVEDLVNGGYFILDHKSTKQIRKDDRILHIDPQVVGYPWAALVMLDLDIRGFLYVEYRKDYPRAPGMLKRPYKGRSFSTNKDQPTNHDLFFNTVNKYDRIALDNGNYDEYLVHLRGKDAPRFHERFSILKTRSQLLNVGDIIYDIASEMVAPDRRIYPSVGTYSCSGCAYYIPCASMFMGEDHEHYLKTSLQKVK